MSACKKYELPSDEELGIVVQFASTNAGFAGYRNIGTNNNTTLSGPFYGVETINQSTTVGSLAAIGFYNGNAGAECGIIGTRYTSATEADFFLSTFTNNILQYTMYTIAGKTMIGTLGTTTPAPGASLHVSGDLSRSSWLTGGVQFRAAGGTFTNTSAAATYATAVASSFGQPTFAASNAGTIVTDAATLYIAAEPAAGTNMTLTNTWGLWNIGKTRLDGVLKLGAGVNNDGGGFKHQRITTGSVGAGATALVTITWTTAFADANYTATASVIDSTTSSLSLSVVHIESKTASAMTVRVLNNAIGSLTGTLDAIAVHD